VSRRAAGSLVSSTRVLCSGPVRNRRLIPPATAKYQGTDRMLSPIQRLKIDLMTNGMSVSGEAASMLSGGDPSRPLTLADYASTSGIAMELEGHIWVNAPIEQYNPNFVKGERQHRFDFRGGRFVVRTGESEVEARPVPVPSYHDQLDPRGVPYTNYAITHTDRVRISPIQGCSYICKFCDLPFKRRYEKMSAHGLVDSIRRAVSDKDVPAAHVLISGGVPRDEDWDWQNEVYEAVPAAFRGMDVDVMMVPVPGHFDAQRLFDFGIHGLAINLEMFDQDLARKIMPRKADLAPSEWLDIIENAVAIFGPGKIRSLLLVGIEPLEATLAGVEAWLRAGAQPIPAGPRHADAQRTAPHGRVPGRGVPAILRNRRSVRNQARTAMYSVHAQHVDVS
jgi:hypothetical protein